MGKSGITTHISVVSLQDGTIITGGINGVLHLWSGRNCSKTCRAHDSAINALYATQDRGIASGGKDGVVKLWAPDLSSLKSFSIASLGSMCPEVSKAVMGMKISSLIAHSYRFLEIQGIPPLFVLLLLFFSIG